MRPRRFRLSKYMLGRRKVQGGVRRAVGLCALVAIGACTTAAPSVSPAAPGAGIRCGGKQVELKTVEAISTEMTLGEITALLGQPERDVGSGVFVFEWDCTDGRRFFASLAPADPQVKPVAVGFSRS